MQAVVPSRLRELRLAPFEPQLELFRLLLCAAALLPLVHGNELLRRAQTLSLSGFAVNTRGKKI